MPNLCLAKHLRSRILLPDNTPIVEDPFPVLDENVQLSIVTMDESTREIQAVPSATLLSNVVSVSVIFELLVP